MSDPLAGPEDVIGKGNGGLHRPSITDVLPASLP
jgi:hypothetical protein